MNELLEKFNEYKDISNYRIKYTLANGEGIGFKLKQTAFPHLIGLHKLVDIRIIGQFNDISNTTVSAKFLISKIKKESQITESIIKNSVYFSNIKQRYQNFSKENLLTLTYTDAIVDFNPLLIGSMPYPDLQILFFRLLLSESYDQFLPESWLLFDHSYLL